MIPIPAPCSIRAHRYGSRHRRAHERHEFGTVFLHVAPEGAADGAIGLVRDGDLITVDATPVALTWRSRAKRWPRGEPNVTSFGPAASYVELYRRHVTQAPPVVTSISWRSSRGNGPTSMSR